MLLSSRVPHNWKNKPKFGAWLILEHEILKQSMSVKYNQEGKRKEGKSREGKGSEIGIAENVNVKWVSYLEW